MGEVGREDHSHVELALQQTVFDGVAFLFVYFDGDVRVPVPQALQVVGEKVADHGVAGGQAQLAAGAYVGERAVEGIVDAALDHVGTVEKVPPGIGQAHALGRALEQ
ncbi:hypothetical protein D3C77_129150 [compost metagenome]